MDLMKLIKEQMAEAAIGKIGEMVGLGEKEAESALGGVIPAILGGFVGKASTPAGLSRVSKVVDEANDTIMDDVLGFLGGDKSQLFDIGGKLLSGLFGSKEKDVAHAVGRSTGVSAQTIASMLKIAGPLVASFLARKKKQEKLDERGLGDLLEKQKPWLKKILPPEVGSAIGFDDIAPTTHAAAPSGGGFMGRLLPLIIMLALAFFAWKFFFNKPDPAPQDPPAATSPDDVMGAALKRVQSALVDVKSLADVQKAVPVIKGATDDLQTLIRNIGTYPPEARAVLGGVAKGLPQMLAEWTKPAGKISGAQEVLTPVLVPFGKAIDTMAAWVN